MIIETIAMTPDFRLQVTDIRKSFPGVRALDGVTLAVRPGEVHALCGENGAGKSTLMNILTGNYQPDAGTIVLNGTPVTIANQQHAQQLGIAIVYQERSLVENLSVAENIFAGTQPVNRWGFISNRKLHAQTRQLLAQLELTDISPRTLVSALSSAQQQMIEIAKALAKRPQLLILDEPTASITERETNTLFRIIRSLAAEGVSVIYISHRMAEIFQIADRVSVLKDGRYQGTRLVKETSVPDIIRLMVGRDLPEIARTDSRQPEVVLEAKNLSGLAFQNVSFQLHRGEILGLAGLVGAGRTEVARAIFGADPLLAGQVLVQGKIRTIRHPADAMQYGIGYLPENRKAQGLFLEMSVAQNVAATHLNAVADKGIIHETQLTTVAEQFRTQLGIRTPGVRQRVLELSGGNQQKVVLAKWLLRKPAVLMVDEPTHGVDVGAKAEIYRILRQLAADGAAILLISSELPEILALSDRIMVMWNGVITASLASAEASETEIMHYASGTKRM